MTPQGSVPELETEPSRPKPGHKEAHCHVQCRRSACSLPGKRSPGRPFSAPPPPGPPAPVKSLAKDAGKGCGMWNPQPRPFPSSHRSDSLGSSPSFQIRPHQARATFTSRFSHRLAFFSHLLPFLSFRSPNPGTSAFGLESARKKI